MSQIDLSGQKIVITGKFSGTSRKELSATLKELGAQVPGSVSKKTSALVAGYDAGSKWRKAHAAGVPVLNHRQLQAILDGEKSFEEVTRLAKTFYTYESTRAEEGQEVDHYNQMGGTPPGFDGSRWPSKNRHLATLDIPTIPALQLLYPEYRTVSVFAHKDVDMYGLGYGRKCHVIFTTQAQIDKHGVQQPKNALKPFGKEILEIITHTWETWEELEDQSAYGYSRILGPPCWLQGEDDPDGFIMQTGEELGIPGDGLLYVFESGLYAQVT